VLTRIHHVRERNRDIVKKRKEQALARHKRLACEACRFDFAACYGEHGQGFIECHHTRPLHTLQLGEKTRLADLALLCANCHRMIHARRPWLELDQLRALLLAHPCK
jgi:5-methylcytosine-specific restriction protein A